MRPRYLLLVGGLLIGASTQPSSAYAVDPAAEKGVEVLARGPVHEGYAEPLEQQPGAGPIVAKQPPDPIDELPPDQKPAGDNVVWLPGYWSWDADREDFIWVSGFWRVTPPNKVWMPGSWRKAVEGFQWVGGFWSLAQQEHAQVEYLPAPPAPLDVGPTTPAPNETSIYVPGAWVHRNRYVWRPGYWIDYNPGWIWIPAHYRWTPAGYVFLDGYWDYALADRGILYAPVYIPPAMYGQPAYYYSPTVVVREQCMFGALFVRRGYGCYYFGDYFEPRYATVGYTSWCGYSGGASVVVVRGWYDPMYSYYRVSYREDPYWRGGMTEMYVGRYRGDIPRPPQTLVQQNNIFINNKTVNNTTIINNTTVNVNNVQMLSTATQVAKANPNLKLQTVSMESRQSLLQSGRQMNTVAVQRGQMESQLLAAHSGIAPRANDAPRSLKLDVPKTFSGRTASVVPKNMPTAPVRVDPVNPIVPNRAPSNPATATNPVHPNPLVGTPIIPKGPANPNPTTLVAPVHPNPLLGNPIVPKGGTPTPKVEPKHQPKPTSSLGNPVPVATNASAIVIPQRLNSVPTAPVNHPLTNANPVALPNRGIAAVQQPPQPLFGPVAHPLPTGTGVNPVRGPTVVPTAVHQPLPVVHAPPPKSDKKSKDDH